MPEPVWRLPPESDARFGAMAYQMINGEVLPRRPVASPLVDQLPGFLVHGDFWHDNLLVDSNLGGIAWSVENNDEEEYADSLIKVHSVLPLIS